MRRKVLRILISLTMIIMMLSATVAVAEASVRIGHASKSENGTEFGKKGDSTGEEVTYRQWYANNWTYVLRPKDPELAEKSAKACEAGCANDNIGYGVPDRNSAYVSYKEVRKMSEIIRSNTDDIAFMVLCGIAGGCSELEYGGNAPSTTTFMIHRFKETGEYSILTDSKYLTKDNYLQRGDILVKENGHTVMVLSDGRDADTPAKAEEETPVAAPEETPGVIPEENPEVVPEEDSEVVPEETPAFEIPGNLANVASELLKIAKTESEISSLIRNEVDSIGMFEAYCQKCISAYKEFTYTAKRNGGDSHYYVKTFTCYIRECPLYGMEQTGEVSADTDYKCPCAGCGHMW